MLCLEKLREWDKLGPQIDKIIASEKNTFNKGILMAWKAREYKRDSYWSNRGEIVKVYEDSHALIEKRPLNNSEEKIYAAFLLEEIKLKTSQHGYVEWKHVTDAAQRLEKRKVDKETIAEGLLLEADFFAENRDHSNATDYAMVGKYEKIIKDYSETIFAARAHLHFGQFAMSRNAFLKALEHFKAIEDNWKGKRGNGGCKA